MTRLIYALSEITTSQVLWMLAIVALVIVLVWRGKS